MDNFKRLYTIVRGKLGLKDHNKLIRDFMETCDVDRVVAIQYLQNNNWILEDALYEQYADGRKQVNLPDLPYLYAEKRTELTKAKALRYSNPRGTQLTLAVDGAKGGTRESRRLTSKDKHVAFTQSSVWGGDGKNMVINLGKSAEVDISEPVTNNNQEVITLTLWLEGFTIIGTELRPYSDPTNEIFLSQIMSGEIPPDLPTTNRSIVIDIIDHSTEHYKSPPPRETFKNLARQFDNDISIDTEITFAGPDSFDEIEENEAAAQANLNFNPIQEYTKLTITLVDDVQISANFNFTHTIGDVYEYVKQARPQYDNDDFMLFTTVNRRGLGDRSVAIQDTGLRNATLKVELKRWVRAGNAKPEDSEL